MGVRTRSSVRKRIKGWAPPTHRYREGAGQGEEDFDRILKGTGVCSPPPLMRRSSLETKPSGVLDLSESGSFINCRSPFCHWSAELYFYLRKC